MSDTKTALNGVAIQPKTVVVQPAKVATWTELDITTIDNAKRKRLRIQVNGQVEIRITGEDYDRLGPAWTDQDIQNLVCDRMGLTLATPTPVTPATP